MIEFPLGGLFQIVWILLTAIAISIALERSRFRKFLPGPVMVLIIPCTLANVGVLPTQSPTYDSISGIAIPVGILLLLLKADIGEILRSSGKMLPPFLLAGVGVVVAILIVGQLMHFDDEGSLWSLLSALFIGSVLNMVATAQAIQADATLVAAILAVNALLAPIYLMILMVLMQSSLIGRIIGVQPGASAGHFAAKDSVAGIKDGSRAPSPPLGELLALIYAVGAFLVVDWLTIAMGIENYSILVVTLVAVAVPNLFPRIREILSGAREMGMIAMFLFIGAVSAQIDLGALGYSSLRVLIFSATALAINLVFLLVIGRLLKSDPHVLFLASLAGVGGPTSTAAVAAAQGREDLVTPGILCALLGVVLSTFIAVLMFQVVGG
ncbi:DUF819 family protein [Altererythrobacter sp. KTW20L]|uniref:DUF819 family protein n=1 Tax=Altererythrobacter sp. KTW20L TaxID=2942210 RepID=UPI0020C0CE48|nr:DUF819 family protein [Altererythrobacter sp. KTW20L]MCL6251555.1 DUF819 family protein [Altererythrobacter sp. KTW20L]